MLRLGDTVIYRLQLADRGNNNGAEIAPAIVTRVWHDGERTPQGPDAQACANLTVLLDSTAMLHFTSVTECADGPEGPLPFPGHFLQRR